MQSEDVPPSSEPTPPKRPNIIFILTDDQRWDSLPGVAPESIPQDVMPNVEQALMQQGVVFTSASVTAPLCCPARASILSGGFTPHNSGVLHNSWPNGGALRFNDRQTLGTLLQTQGYRTALIGKYVNQYWALDGYDDEGHYIPSRRYVPPGWNVWLGYLTGSDGYNGGWYVTAGGNGSQTAPAAGLLLPHDIRLPHDVSLLEEFLQALEPEGFPDSLRAFLGPLYTQKGDYNHDGDRDLDDFIECATCWTGPYMPMEPSCEACDCNADGYPDLVDFAFFQNAFGRLPYITDFHKNAALAFLDDDEIVRQPFFLVISTPAPHDPALPAEEDEDLFQDFEYRARAWGEEDVSDKPPHVRDYVEPRFSEYYAGATPFDYEDRLPDAAFADQLRCLRSVDRLVGEIAAAVERNEDLRENTVIIFTSDNGYLWGEHKRFWKGQPYEESISVPLVIRMPGVWPQTISGAVAMDLDVPATILELAGYTLEEIEGIPLSEGQSLLSLMEDPSAQWRDHRLFEVSRTARPGIKPAWSAIRTEQWKYIQYDYLEAGVLAEELYNLSADPHEMDSLHDRSEYEIVKNQLSAMLEQERGLIITGMIHPWGTVPGGRLGLEYHYALGVHGGTAPYDWTLFKEDPQLSGLPDGLSLARDGVLSGTPTQSGVFDFDVRVEDGSISPHHGGPQWCVVRMQIGIAGAGRQADRGKPLEAPDTRPTYDGPQPDDCR